MRLVSGKCWTFGRKLMGNVIPAAIALPFGIYGVALMLERERIVGQELWLIACMPAASWLGMNFFGLFQNGTLKVETARKLKLGPPQPGEDRYFVGFARPTYRGLLDPHEDVGFLLVLPDRLEFRGDTQHARLARREIVKVGFRPNIHTWVGLGRWVAVDGLIEGKAVRMLVEPRERATLLGNLLLSKVLERRLRSWLRGEPLN